MSIFEIGIRSLVFTKYTVCFKKGTLFHKTPNVSSGMSVEQTNERNNDLVKGPRYAMGRYRKSLCIHTLDGRIT